LIGKLPKFVAGDLARVPPFNPCDLYMTLLILCVTALESRMSTMVCVCVLRWLERHCKVMQVRLYSIITVSPMLQPTPLQVQLYSIVTVSPMLQPTPLPQHRLNLCQSWNIESAAVLEDPLQQAPGVPDWAEVVNKKVGTKPKTGVSPSIVVSQGKMSLPRQVR